MDQKALCTVVYKFLFTVFYKLFLQSFLRFLQFFFFYKAWLRHGNGREVHS